METIENHLNELRSFYYVAKYQSFTKAQDHLPISKAQISKEVSRLETVLGLQLLFRTTRTVRLTEEGESLYEQAMKIFSLTQETAEIMEDVANESSGSIKITVPGTLGDWLIPHLIEEVSVSQPNLKLEFDTNIMKRNLIEEKIDFAIRAMDVDEPHLVAKYLGHIRDAIVVSKKFYKKHQHILDENNPECLKEVECLLSSHQKNWNIWSLSKGKKSYEVEVNGRYSMSRYNTIKMLALKGVAVAKLPYMDAKAEIDRGELIQLFSNYKITTHPLYLVYPHAQYTTALKNRFKKTLYNYFKENSQYLI